MTFTTTNYLNLSPISKTGIGGAITAAAYVGFGITNPLTLVAATALGQGLAWLPDMARRCFRRAPAPHAPLGAVPIPGHPVPPPAALSLREELELQAALEMSRQQPARHREQDDTDRALALSLGDEDEKHHAADGLQRALRMSLDPQQQVKVCRLARAFKGALEADPIKNDEIIPEQFLVDAGKNQYYHLGNLVLSLLSSHSGSDKNGNLQWRDALGKIFTVDDLRLFEARMGLNQDEFVNIWVRATLPGAPDDIDPDTQASRRTTYRMCLLRDALSARTSSPAVNKLRGSYLHFFKTKDVWNRLPALANMA